MNEVYLLILAIVICILVMLIGVKIDKSLVALYGIVWMGFFTGYLVRGVRTDIKETVLYKVKELERNTIFTISDREGAYNVNDTVWVNMTTRKVDTVDSNAMLCVIIKEL